MRVKTLIAKLQELVEQYEGDDLDCYAYNGEFNGIVIVKGREQIAEIEASEYTVWDGNSV